MMTARDHEYAQVKASIPTMSDRELEEAQAATAETLNFTHNPENVAREQDLLNALTAEIEARQARRKAAATSQTAP